MFFYVESEIIPVLILTSSVDSIDFGISYINETSNIIFTVSAGGTSSEIVTLSDNSNQFNFSPSTFSLTGSVTNQIITASFIPTSEGIKTGILTLSSSGGNVKNISLIGSGIYQNLILTSSIDSYDFGSQYTGQTASITFTISAAGTGQAETVTIQNVDNWRYSKENYSFSPSSFVLIGGGPSQTVTVNYIPSGISIQQKNELIFSSSGGYTKNISFTGSGTYWPVMLTASVNSIDFGNGYVSEQNNTFEIDITIPGVTRNTFFKVLDNSDEFSYSPSTISLFGENDIKKVYASFTPTSIGVKTGTLILSSSDSTVYIPLTGTAIYRPLILTASVEPISFGYGLVNQTSSTTFTVSAAGIGQTETVTLSDNSSQFDFSPNSFSLVGGGASQTVTARFTPTSTGVKTGTLTLSSSGGNIKNISIDGTGANPLVLTSSVNSVNFDNGYINETGSSTFTVSAGGIGAEIVTLSDNSNQFDFSPSSFSLTGSGASQTVTAKFTPTSSGTKTGTLTLSSSGGGTKNISLTGTGIYRPLVLTSSVSSINFGYKNVGQTSSINFTVSADGIGQTETVTLSDNSSQFDFSPSSFTLTGGGANQTVTAKFIPTSSGAKTATLTLSSSGGSTKNISLTGSGVFATATGGTTTDYTDNNNITWRIHKFGVGDTNVTFTQGGQVEYLIAGGGGQGGHAQKTTANGNGGNGGKIVTGSINVSSGQSWTFTVGLGGGVQGSPTSDGLNSIAFGIIASGGYAGSYYGNSGSPTIAGNPGFGNNNSAGTKDGVLSAIEGSWNYYGGGGGGGSSTSSTNNAAGAGGGGNAICCLSAGSSGNPGTHLTGGGGAGASRNTNTSTSWILGAAGGHGVIIMRYRIA